MPPNFSHGPDYWNRTRLISDGFGIGTDLWSLIAVSDVDNTVADSIGAKYIPMCHHVLDMKYNRCIETMSRKNMVESF